ncbi:MAG: putative Ig domain-containing protein, partial [Kangiellaceae bacterium]
MLTSYIRIAQRVSILTILVLLPQRLHAAPPVINYVSGAGPHPLGTTSVTIEILTDVVSNCRLNDVDDGNPGQWSTLLATSNSLNHTSEVTLSNDTDTARYIYCRNVSTGEVSSSYTFDISFVSSTNTAPTIDTTTSTTEVFEDSQYTYDVDATDAEDGTSLIYSLNSPPSDMTIDENSGLIQWTPDNDDVGNHAINIVVTDSGGLTDTEDFTLNIVNVNDAPLITSTDVTNANEGSSYSYDVEATDPDLNDSLTYTLLVKPDGMDIDPTTGLISWVPSSAQVGSNSVEIVVTDIEGATDQRMFTITVDEANVAPEIISTHVLNAAENVAYIYDVDATDANNNDTLTYELDVNPPLMSIAPLTGVINWTPDNSDVGEHNVTVIVSDQSGLSDSESFVITVANVNGAPVFNSEPDLTAVEDEPYSYDANATDDDSGDVITYSLDSPPAGMTIDPASGVVEWVPNSSQIGDHNINIDATDLDGLVTAHDYVLTVSAAVVDVGPVRTYVSGAGPLSSGTTSTTMAISTNVVATCRYNNVDDNNPTGWTTNFSSSNGTDHTATVDLVNDENTTRYVICRDSSSGVVNQIAFVFNITFEEDNNQAPVIDSTEIISATVDVEYIYDVEASDPDAGDTLTYDLTTSPPSMLIDQDTGVITWTPVTSDVGDHDVVVEVADQAGLTATQPYTLTVSNVVNQEPTITTITDVTVDEDNATDLIEFTVADAETADSDLTVTGSSDDLALVTSDNVVVNQVSGGDWTVVVTPEDNVSGIAPIVITVEDGDGGLQTTTFNVTINAVNDEPTITTVADQTISEDGVTAALEFTVGDIETPAVDLEVTGTSSIVALVPNGNVEVIRVNDSGLWTVQVTPLPDQSGTTTITLTVTDGDLGEQASTFDLTVNGVNDSPTITDIADQTIDEDTTTTELSFTVSDTETAVEDLEVSVISENTALVEEAGLNLNNSGDGVWTLTVTPVDDANGEVDIVVSVTDGITPVDEVFRVTVNAVNDAPTITSISDQTINEDTSTTALEFTVADIDSDQSSLIVTATSFDETLVRSEEIVLDDNGSGLWTVVVSPIENVNGSVPITVSVSDGGPDIEESFSVTILSINDAPSITSTEITTATENTIYSYAVEAIDPDLDDTLTYSLETPPELMSIDPDSGLIEWTPISSDVGQHSINIIVTDLDGLTDSQEFVLDVSASDSDNDGVIDSLDQCPDTPSGETANSDGCSPSQLDSDSDGVTDDIDQCADTPTDEVADANGCSPSQNQGPFVSSIIPQTGSDVIVNANDDASLQKGTQLSFSRNAIDEIVVDSVNNLTWLDTVSVATDFMDWTTATDYCETLDHAGIDSWRLPTKYELLFLLDYSHNLADGAPTIVDGFQNTAASRYWTDFYELLNLSGGGTSEIATAVDFGNAKVSESRIQNRITSQKNVRCVSGDVKFEPEFSFRNVTHLKTVVYDSANKLMWQDTEEVTTDLHSWNDAINYCENLELDDSTDWRLPNIKEYFTLIDEDQFEPNYSNRDTFWTSTTIELDGGTQRAIRVTKDAENFATQSDSAITQSHYVRCVKDYSKPVAISGGDRTAVVGELITFDGGQSFDPDGTITAYQWVDPSSEVIYLDEVRYSTSYSRSEVYETSTFGIGTHEIGLSVEDNNRLKTIDIFTLTIVAEANIAPIANDQNANVDEDSSVEIILDATDSNSDTLTYEIVDLPTNGDAVLVGVNSVTYTPAADFFGTDSFTFRVNDGEFDSNLATVTIDVASVNGGAPTANAGEDQTVLLGATVSLDGSASTDDELIVSYEWIFDSNIVSTSSSFEVSDLEPGIHEYTLTVYDAEGLSGTDSVSITVNYPLEQCTITQSDSDYGFVDVFPDEDINWTGNSFSDVLEIETAFNHARQSDQSVFKFLSMPEQSEWDGFTLQQKALYLINSEREARGIKPFTGASPQVVTVAQNYADYLVTNNEVITHTRSSDGASPTERLEEDSDILGNHEGTSENLYSAFFAISDSEVLVDAIYRWMYMDKEPLSGSAWGHRSGLLKTGLQENNDSEFEEGLIGFGIATGDYDPLGVSVDGQGAVVVFNSIDQKSAWDNSNTEIVDISNAHLCNTDVPLVLDETQFETANLSSLTISPTYLSLNPGESAGIIVSAYYSDGTSSDISAAASFIADDRSVVSVSAGVITAESIGYATVFASVGDIDSNRVSVIVGEETDTGNLTGTYGEQYLSYVPSNSTISHYDPKTFTLFNGTVLDRNNLPMAGVTISFHNSPQYGSVVTDSLGQFIIAGEAGRRTIVYSREGYVTLQRTANAISNSWKTIENVILLEKDTKVTSIDLTSGVAQTHQSSIITDGFGSRATTLVFSGINQATITAQDGSTRILDEFLVRATEAEFPESMPAGLPEETEFTYCSELDIVGVGYEEAVDFDNPVVMYVDNFLGFSVGEIVPIGYFTGRSTNWEASDNGVVVKLLDSDSNGLVDGVDYTGDDIADDIDGDGSTTDEAAGIENYEPNSLYWRGSFNHFTWFDFNWGSATPAVERLHVLPEPKKEDKDDKDCVSTNSYVKPKPLALHEDIPVTGTNLTLHYSSQRTHGYHHKIAVNVSDETIPDGLNEIVAILEIGGNRFEQTFSAAALQDAEFIWDGTDPDGNIIHGLVTGKISVGHKLLAEYYSAGNAATSGQPLDSFSNAWAQYGSETTGVSGREDQTIWSSSPVQIFNVPESQIANGWSLSNHHVAAGNELIHRGDGEAQEVKPMSLILKTGIVDSQHEGDDGFYQKGGSHINYQINEQGDLHDKVTGLTWEYLLNPVPRYDTYANAQAHCDSLNVGGEDENNTWR